MKKITSLFAFLVILSVTSFAQVRKIPAAVTTAFEKQYPTARDVEYRDMLASIHVHFVQDSAKMTAKYSAKGEWKETEKEWSFEQLPSEVQDGFHKSKYADEWKVTETAIIYSPGGLVTYRLKVEKNDLQKKYLFFNQKGRLLRDSLTI